MVKAGPVPFLSYGTPFIKTAERLGIPIFLDNLRGKVPRSRAVKLEALDRNGNTVVLDWEEFPAVVLQHEIDHLRGHLFVDRMKDMSTLTHLGEFHRYWIKGEKNVEEV